MARSQGILIPHLVLPLGILPPDSGDSVPGSRSRGERQVTRLQTGCPRLKSQLSGQQEAGWADSKL